MVQLGENGHDETCAAMIMLPLRGHCSCGRVAYLQGRHRVPRFKFASEHNPALELPGSVLNAWQWGGHPGGPRPFPPSLHLAVT